VEQLRRINRDAQEDHQAKSSRKSSSMRRRQIGVYHSLQGDDPTEVTVEKNRIGRTRWTVEADIVDLACVLARQLPDMAIAAILHSCRVRSTPLLTPGLLQNVLGFVSSLHRALLRRARLVRFRDKLGMSLLSGATDIASWTSAAPFSESPTLRCRSSSCEEVPPLDWNEYYDQQTDNFRVVTPTEFRLKG
jgi:hypothetical protein